MKAMQFNFTHWEKWPNRNNLDIARVPGIYILAITDKNISKSSFIWLQEICYVGMTNSYGGLGSRLNAFERTIKGKRGHGGASRFLKKYPNYEELQNILYVSVQTFNANPLLKKTDPVTLNLLGDVAKHEYTCIAEYLRRFKRLPLFNDYKNAPKK